MGLPSVDRVLTGAVTRAPIDFAAKDHGFASMLSGRAGRGPQNQYRPNRFE
jgi:hypothetical protein